MPAIIGANQTTFDYDFGLNKTVTMSFPEHVSRQTCHVWLTASLASYFPSAALVAKAGLDLIGRFKSLSWLKPRENIIGHTLPLVGRPLNFAWNRPLTSGLMLLAAATFNVVLNFFVCMGEHIYSLRSTMSDLGGEKLLDRIDVMFAVSGIRQKIELDFNQTESNLIKIPQRWIDTKHTFAHIDPRWISEGYDLVRQDPKLHEIMNVSDLKNQTDQLFVLIQEKLKLLLEEKHPEHTEL